jgi:hypothetical protein
LTNGRSLVVGQIYYTNGTVSSAYDSSLTPAGIVCALKDDGSVKSIVAVTESSEGLKWADAYGAEYSTTFSTSTSDGSGNWAVICEADTTAGTNAATEYPAFNYCNTYSVSGLSKTWYMPAKKELDDLYKNRTAINAGLTVLTDGGYSGTVTLLGTGVYWSSSQSPAEGYYAYDEYFSYGLEYEYAKSSKCGVRCITSF